MVEVMFVQLGSAKVRTVSNLGDKGPSAGFERTTYSPFGCARCLVEA